jgi:methylated-DNA-[protein]-cysteine S-methyltransferase
MATDLGRIEIREEGGRLCELNFTTARPTPLPTGDPIVAELERYFRGEPVSFDDIQVDFGDATPFQRHVYEATRAIPWGKAATYGQVAKMIGKPDAQRAVGQALGRNPVAIVIPCHRVVASGGIGGFGGGLTWKRKLLRLEGFLR